MLTILLPIWLLHIAALASPGANMLLVSQLAASEHGRSAVFAALGVATGTLAWASFAVLGVHAVFSLFPGLRLALQIAGGLYLLHVASRLWRSRSVDIHGGAAGIPADVAFRRGLLTNLTNPKSALFFGSVLAASFPLAPSVLLQVCAVAMIVSNALCWHLLLVYLFSRPTVRAAYARTRSTANRVAGVAVGALGLGLLVTSLREARA